MSKTTIKPSDSSYSTIEFGQLAVSLDSVTSQFILPIPRSITQMVELDIKDLGEEMPSQLFGVDSKINPTKFPTLYMLKVIYEEFGVIDLKSYGEMKTSREFLEVLAALEDVNGFIGLCIGLQAKYNPLRHTEKDDSLSEKISNIGIAVEVLKTQGYISSWISTSTQVPA